jgi:hypothetical protein
MPIADDWDHDYPNTTLRHVDGVLSYDGGSIGQAVVGEYIYGVVTGAYGKVIARTGNDVSGTYTLTNEYGLFDDGEALEVLSELNFDSVANSGFKPGDQITGASSGSTLDVVVVEYNRVGDGAGTMFGIAMSAAFTNLENLEKTSVPATTVAAAVGVGTDNDATNDSVVNGTLAVPGSANDSVIIHYDTGTVAIPEQAILEDATTGALGLVEQVTGVTATGSLRLVDHDTGTAYGTGNQLRVTQVVAYDNLQAGEIFSVGKVVVGGTSGATGRVLADTGTELILADESDTWVNDEQLELTDGTYVADVVNSNTTLNVAFANIPGGVRTEQRPTSVGGSVGQGGIYAAATSLNIVRKLNSLYTLAQGTTDELLQLDDDEPMDAAFKGFAYSMLFDWLLEQGSDRFLRQGALIDTTGAEVWANTRTVGAQNKITDTAFLIDTTQTFRQPQLYIEQDDDKVDPWWLEGNIDILLRVRTRQDARYIAPTTPTLGQLIPGGDPAINGGYTVFNREFYTSTYDATEVDGSAGVVDTAALGTGSDTTNNDQGTHTMAWDNGSAATLLVGEEIFTVAGNNQKVGLVVAQTGDATAAGTVDYVLKSGAQFDDGDAVTAKVSGKTLDVDETGGFDANNNLVAGFGNDIRYGVVDIIADPVGGTGIATGPFICGEGVLQQTTLAFGFLVELDKGATDALAIEIPLVDVAAVGNGITGVFLPGEQVTQQTTLAVGTLIYADATNNTLYIRADEGSATFASTNDIDGDESGALWDSTGATYPAIGAFAAGNDIDGLTSGAVWDASGTPTYATAVSFDADLNNGDGNQPYAGANSNDITGANTETVKNSYQYSKYLSRAEEIRIRIAGPGTADDGTIGRFYRRMKDTYAEIKPGDPFGVYTGSMAFAQGWFLNTTYVDAADIRAFSVIDDNGITRLPPNLQSLAITGVDVGWRVAAYRSTAPASTAILRTEFDIGVIGAGNNEDTDSTVLVGANTRTISPLPADVPDVGVLRILSPNGTGNYIRMTYSSVDRTNNIFTLTAAISTFLAAAGETSTTDLVLDDNCHVVFIEEQAAAATVTNTIQYVSDIPIVYKARLKGFKPFRSTGLFTNAGASLGVVQTEDTIVDLP